jgi:hypothetical protein
LLLRLLLALLLALLLIVLLRQALHCTGSQQLQLQHQAHRCS